MNLGHDDDLLTELFEEKKEEKIKSTKVEIPDWIFDNSNSIIEAVEGLEDLNTLKAILMLKHPQTGIQASEFELKQFVCDLPFISISVFNLYLQVKQEKETLIDTLDTTNLKFCSVYEEEIKKKWFEEKEKKLRSAVGVISKNQIEMAMADDEEAQEILRQLRDKIRELSFKEEMLAKINKLLDLRSYEIQTLLKIEMGLSK